MWELTSEGDFTTEIKEPDKARGLGVSFRRGQVTEQRIQAEKQQETRGMMIVKNDRVMEFGKGTKNFIFIYGL